MKFLGYYVYKFYYLFYFKDVCKYVYEKIIYVKVCLN